MGSIIFEKQNDVPLGIPCHPAKFGFFKSEVAAAYEIDFFVALGWDDII